MIAITRLFGAARRNTLVTFAIGALVVWFFEQGLQALMTIGGLATVLLAIAIVVLLTAAFVTAVRAVRRRREPPRRFLGPQPASHAGLICLFSKMATLSKALEFHSATLEYLWLVTTPQVMTDTLWLESRYPTLRVFSENIEDAWKPAETTNAIERALAHARTLGLSTDQVIVDITGGTTAMTYGAGVATRTLGLNVQMVPGQYDAILNVQRPLEVIKLEV